MTATLLALLLGLGAASAAEPVYKQIKTVHVINSCHLDIGFADSSAGIINQYFDHHLPMAAAVGKQMQAGVAGYSDRKLGFMFQSWVVALYFDCPPGMGVHCPSAAAQATAREAIAAGHITWHAFPHNAELEVMGADMIEAGLEMTFALDKKFAQPKKATLSQRDVPGMTRALVPILKKQGVTAISIGANDGSTPPDVPPCFLWKDKLSGETLVGLFNWPGYGSLPLSHQMTCLVDGLEHALVYNWNGDNAGPSAAKDYAAHWATVQKAFPNANVYASTLDNFTQHLLEPAVMAKLPVVSKEIGDTWIYGVPSDPQKVSRMRVMNKAWGGFAASKGGMAAALASDAVFRNATRFALKLGEHTWGKDVKSNLRDNWSWLNKDFEKAKAPGSKNASQYAVLESSWWEQREWGIAMAIDTLKVAKHPLGEIVQAGFDRLNPAKPAVDGFKPGKAGQTYTCGKLKLAFDRTGAISTLTDGTGYQWADTTHTLLSLKYRSYSAADVGKFFAQYCKSTADWVKHDYGKPGLPDSVVGKMWTTTMVNLYSEQRSDGGCSFRVQSAFDKVASEQYGAAAGWTSLEVAANGTIGVEVGMFNKSTTRIPEAMFMQFQVAETASQWSANKLGEWITPGEIVDGGTKHLHGVTEDGLRVASKKSSGRTMQIAAEDAAVANFGQLTAYPSPVNTTADTATFGSSFVLWDNLWGTNYIMWWPFIVPPPAAYAASSAYFPGASNNNMLSRFTITLT